MQCECKLHKLTIGPCAHRNRNEIRVLSLFLGVGIVIVIVIGIGIGIVVIRYAPFLELSCCVG